ncbi:MAG: hypothetical protein AB1442_10500 [Nitrospirota bacterium]
MLNEISIQKAIAKYRRLSFPLAGNLSFVFAKKDAGQARRESGGRAGMTKRGV